MWRGVVAGLLTAGTLSGCGLFFGRSQPPPAARTGTVQTGMASWYGPGFHGKQTASGEVFDQHELTAAHQSLPMGTRALVTSLENGRQVEVRINDRGPFAKGRVIDLSYAAAQTLGMIGPGTVPVRIELLGGRRVSLAPVAYTIQVGSFADRNNAVRLQRTLAKRFDGVYLATLEGQQGTYYRVRLGRFAQRDQAVRFARTVAPLGLPAVIVEDGRAP